MDCCLLLLIVTVATLMSSSNIASGANILFYWGVSGYSHRISVWPLIEKLAEKGHNITFFSPYPSRNPPDPKFKIIDIVPKNLSRDLGLANIDFLQIRLEKGPQGASDLWDDYFESGIRGCKSLMENPEVIEWVRTSSFDLVVFDLLWNECGYAFMDHFKAPRIDYSPSSLFPWLQESFRIPEENVPDMQYFPPLEMTFVQRVQNLLRPLYWRWKKYSEMFPVEEEMAKKAFGLSQAPNYDEIEKNVSLVFVSDHHSIDFPRSLPPLFVNVAGIHCRDEIKPLPKV
jgi:glucuronosyltransferase